MPELSFSVRSLQCRTQDLERSIDRRGLEPQNLRDKRINIHVLKRLQLNAWTNIRPRGKKDRLHLRHRARIEAVASTMILAFAFRRSCMRTQLERPRRHYDRLTR